MSERLSIVAPEGGEKMQIVPWNKDSSSRKRRPCEPFFGAVRVHLTSTGCSRYISPSDSG